MIGNILKKAIKGGNTDGLASHVQTIDSVEYGNIDVLYKIRNIEYFALWEPVLIIPQKSSVTLKGYYALYNKLKSDQNSIKLSIQNYQLFSPGALSIYSAELYKDLRLVNEKIEAVKKTIKYLKRWYNDCQKKSWDLYETAKEKLKSILSVSEQNLLTQVSLAEDNLKPSEYDKKWSIRLISTRVIRAFKIITRDIREYFRNILRLLFKNMDDSEHNSIVNFQSKEINYLIVNYQHFGKRIFNQTYRAAA
jgi:hypothetical protein